MEEERTSISVKDLYYGLQRGKRILSKKKRGAGNLGGIHVRRDFSYVLQ